MSPSTNRAVSRGKIRGPRFDDTGSNRVGNIGAEAFAFALKSNETMLKLSLPSNMIND